MAFDSDSIGVGDDAVRLVLGGEDVLVAKRWEVKQSILTQPAAFSMTLGWGDVAKDLAKKYPANTPFELYVGKVLRQTGRTDGYELSDGDGATDVTIRGRDDLAPLHDAYVRADRSIANGTYETIVKAAIEEAGISGYSLVFDNDANRKAISGVGIKTTGTARDPRQAAAVKAAQAKVGEREYDHVKRMLDRAGFFLWAGTENTFILSEPHSQQKPAYRVLRRRGQTRDEVNVSRARYKNETTQRFSECIIYGRGGGKKFGRQKTHGTFVDAEMVALGYDRPLVARDTNVTNPEQAEFYARRKLAESRRASWQLVYTLSGHTTISLYDGKRAVWTPDTTVEVVDDEYGLNDVYWIESVEFRGPPSTTTITLMRRADLVFGSTE